MATRDLSRIASNATPTVLIRRPPPPGCLLQLGPLPAAKKSKTQILVLAPDRRWIGTERLTADAGVQPGRHRRLVEACPAAWARLLEIWVQKIRESPFRASGEDWRLDARPMCFIPQMHAGHNCCSASSHCALSIARGASPPRPGHGPKHLHPYPTIPCAWQATSVLPHTTLHVPNQPKRPFTTPARG